MIEDFECPICFLQWEEGEDTGAVYVQALAKPKKCEYCLTHEMTDTELLERRLELMGQTNLYHMPTLIQQMYAVLSEQGEPK